MRSRKSIALVVATLALVLAVPRPTLSLPPEQVDVREAPADIFCNGRAERQTVQLAPSDEAFFLNLMGEETCICSLYEDNLKESVQAWALDVPGEGGWEAVEKCKEHGDLDRVFGFDGDFSEQFQIESGAQKELVVFCYTTKAIEEYCVSVRDIPRAEG